MPRSLLCMLVLVGTVETVVAREPFDSLAQRILHSDAILLGSVEHVSRDGYALKVERVLFGRAPEKRIVRVIRDGPHDCWARTWKLRVGLRVLVFARSKQGAYGPIGGGGAGEVALVDAEADIPYAPGIATVSEEELLETVQAVLKARASVSNKPVAAFTSFLAAQNALTKRLGLDMALRHARVHGPLSLSPDLLEGLLWGQDRFLSSLTAANLAMLAGNRTATRLRPTIEKKLSHAGSWRARFTAALALCNLDPQNLDAHKTLLRSIPELTLAYPDAFAIHLALSRVEQKPRTNARALHAVAAAALRRTNDRSLLATFLSYLNLIHGESFYVPAHRVVEIRDEWLKKLER